MNAPPPPGGPEPPGLEAAGAVEGTGERVFFLLPGGGYAEKVAVPKSMLMPIPDRLSFEEAAAVPEAWFTAYLNLFREGKMLTSTEDHRPLGEWWESQGGSWGGRFQESAPGKGDGNDGNHYSSEHNGCR